MPSCARLLPRLPRLSESPQEKAGGEPHPIRRLAGRAQADPSADRAQRDIPRAIIRRKPRSSKTLRRRQVSRVLFLSRIVFSRARHRHPRRNVPQARYRRVVLLFARPRSKWQKPEEVPCRMARGGHLIMCRQSAALRRAAFPRAMPQEIPSLRLCEGRVPQIRPLGQLPPFNAQQLECQLRCRTIRQETRPHRLRPAFLR